MRKSEKVKMECCLDVLWLFYYEMEECNYCLVNEKVRERRSEERRVGKECVP